MSHKGSRSRIQDQQAARDTWERVFGKKVESQDVTELDLFVDGEIKKTKATCILPDVISHPTSQKSTP